MWTLGAIPVTLSSNSFVAKSKAPVTLKINQLLPKAKHYIISKATQVAQCLKSGQRGNRPTNLVTLVLTFLRLGASKQF